VESLVLLKEAKMGKAGIYLCIAILGVGSLFAQERGGATAQRPQDAPIININIQRTIQTVDYRTHGSTKIDFRGTALSPQAKGEAKIDAKNGSMEIGAEFEDLPPAAQFGNAYLTYVLWAVTPEGRANNLGELMVDKGKSKLTVTTRLQNFGLMVTAEPFFAVTAPSEDVILENIVRTDTQGQVDTVSAKYELLQRGRYREMNLAPLSGGPGAPLSLIEARNAMRIAQWRQAEKYAPESWERATAALNRAEDFEARRESKAVATAARDAAQAFEDAIAVSAKRQGDEREAAEHQASADREAQARAGEQAEAQRRAEAEKQKLQAEANAAREAAARTQAEQAQADAEHQRSVAEADAAAAHGEAAKAEEEKEELRASLLQQFNLVLETRDTVRGLVVNIGDVLFETGKYDLRPEARERLAKLSGIVLAHPGLNLAVEGTRTTWEPRHSIRPCPSKEPRA
jgi:flagellar motor protein MotB